MKRSSIATFLALLGAEACSSHTGTMPTATRQHTGHLSIVLKIPSAAPASSAQRRRDYISPATQSVWIDISGALSIYANVTPGSPGCTATQSGTLCTFDNIGAPVGQTQITVTAYDAPLPPPGSKAGNVLSAGSTTAKIVEGQVNVVQLALGGVPGKAQITSLDTSPVNGKATDLHFAVKIMDADGYTIVGSTPYSNSAGQSTPVGVGISQSAPLGYAPSFQFVVNGVTSANGMAIASPNDTYSIVYPGNGVISATLQLQQTGSPILANATITPKAAAAALENVPQLESGAALLSPGGGAFWFTEPSKNAIGYLANGIERDIVLPSGHTPTQLAIGPAFMYGQTFVFGTQQGTVGYLTADGVRGEYALPTNSPVGGVAYEFNGNGPYEIAYTQPGAHKVGVSPLFGGTITEFTLPQNATPGKMNAGNIFVDPGRNAVGVVDASGWQEYPLPTAGSDPTDVAYGSGEYEYWIAEAGGNRLAELDMQTGKVTEFPTDAPLTSIASIDEDEVIGATDTSGNVEYFQPDGSRATFTTASAGPAAQILGYSQSAFVYECSSCAANLQEFLY